MKFRSALLGQQRRPGPKRLSWREALLKYFGIDLLLGSQGELMHWAIFVPRSIYLDTYMLSEVY